MRYITTILAVLVIAGCSLAPPKTMLGGFSNEAEGFHTKAVLFIEHGKGMYQGIPMLWTHDAKTSEVTVTLPPDAPLETYAFKLRFDPAKEEFTILDPKLAEDSQPLHRIRLDIPAKVTEMLKKFDGTMKSIEQ
jgi:hypothetical protein